MEEIKLSDYKPHMKSYFLVKKIYDIYDEFSEKEEDPIEFKSIIINNNILDYIRDINFTFVANVGIIEDIKELKKIGILLNFEVFLDPNMNENKIIFQNQDKDKNYELLVIE